MKITVVGMKMKKRKSAVFHISFQQETSINTEKKNEKKRNENGSLEKDAHRDV